jgi:peptidoglycan/LPS O-acetylase OafA/YrhL
MAGADSVLVASEAEKQRPQLASKNLLPVQTLRAIAALSVCVVHFNSLELMLIGRANDPLPLYSLASGVDLFFVISGFVMVYSSERLFGEAGGSGIFLRRRLVRIVPLYWVMMAFGIYAESIHFDVVSLLKSYLFIPFVATNGQFTPLYGVGWTLNFEMFFYVVFAGAIFFRRELAAFAVSFFLICVVVLGQCISNLPAPLRFWSDPIVVEFVFGIVLALAYRRGIRLPRWAGLVLCVAGAIAIWHGVPRQVPSGDRWLTCGIPAAMIFAGLVFQPSLDRVHRLFGALGDASYAMYLLHSIILAAILIWWSRGLNTYPLDEVLAGGLILTIVLSVGIFHGFERPLTMRLRRGIRQELAGRFR